VSGKLTLHWLFKLQYVCATKQRQLLVGMTLPPDLRAFSKPFTLRE
jgi:hypothetical protein